uniref:Uncharacterized protein n=1 Tax=viral metagenome TaxID=1070528 RepID=A0A6C0CI34_9ZZZZ
MAAPAPPQEQKGMFSGLTDAVSGAFDSASKAVGLKKDDLTPPGVAPETPGYTATGGRRRKTRGGKRRSTRKTTRRVRKAKKSRKH